MEGWDQRKFEETLATYLQVTSRTLQSAINTKAYYIARKAIWFTTRSDAGQISRELGGLVTVSRLNKKGKMVRSRKLQLVQAREVAAPLAALIVNARRGRAGDRGYYGRAMDRALRDMLSARRRSVAFIKSGWLASVKILAPLADRSGQPATDTTAKQVGRAKGTATPAKAGFNPVAEIVNLASARKDTKGAQARVGGEGLRIAFNDERASMDEYIRKKMMPDAEAFNRANR